MGHGDAGRVSVTQLGLEGQQWLLMAVRGEAGTRGSAVTG